MKQLIPHACKADMCPSSQPSRIVVLDDIHSLLLGAASSDANGAQLLSALLRIREQSGANLALLLISGHDSSAVLLKQVPMLQVVHFPQYGEGEVASLLLKVDFCG